MTASNRLRVRLGAVALCLTAVGVSAPAHATSYDLAGVWLFNEGAGQTAYDLSFSGNTGQLGSTPGADANDPSWVQLPRLGLLKRAALHFEGDDFVQVRNAPALEPDGVTVVARIRSTGPGKFRYVVSKGALACWTASYGLYTDGDGALRFYVSDGSSFTLSPPASAGTWDGAWHTVVGVYDGTGVSLWVDHTLVGTTPANVTIGYGLPQADGLYIGTYAGPCSNPMGFVGDIDGVALIGSYADAGVGGLVG